jgi:hypothetical protein
MQQIRIGVLVLGIVAGLAAQAGAQQAPWNDRVFANVSFGVQVGSEDVSRTQVFDIYQEQASIRTTSEVGSGPAFDVVVGGRLRGPFGAALGLMFRNKDRDATIDASIPDPIFFDQPRTVARTLGGLTHGETWITPMFVWYRPLTELVEDLELMVMAGPAIVRVEHEQVGTDFTLTETPGGPDLGVTTGTVNKTGVGFSIGGDLRYLLTPTIGVGGFLRFARASVDVADDVSLDVGGLQLGVGVRIRY